MKLSSLRQLYITTSLLLMSLVLSHTLQAESLNIENARVSPTIKGLSVSTVYFDITNHHSNDITLTKVSSDLTDHVEIHEHVMQKGLMQMREAEQGVVLTSGETTQLKPGGYHIMLMNLQKVINEGDKINLVLCFSHGESQTITATAKKITHHH